MKRLFALVAVVATLLAIGVSAEARGGRRSGGCSGGGCAGGTCTMGGSKANAFIEVDEAFEQPETSPGPRVVKAKASNDDTVPTQLNLPSGYVWVTVKSIAYLYEDGQLIGAADRTNAKYWKRDGRTWRDPVPCEGACPADFRQVITVAATPVPAPAATAPTPKDGGGGGSQ